MPIVPQFKQIRPVDFQTSSNILDQAGRSMERGLDAFGGVLGDLRGRATARKAFASEGNDRAIAANLETFKNLGDIQQAEDAGSFTDTNLFQKFGSNYSQKGAKDALSAVKSRLKGKATDEATSIANQAATESGDMTKGTAAFRQHMLSRGAKSSDVDAATNKWAAGNEALKGEIGRAKEQIFEDAFSQYQDASRSGVNTSQAITNISSKIIDPKQRRRFTEEAKKWDKIKSSLTTDQKAEIEFETQKDNDQIALAQQQGNERISALQAGVSAIPNPISPEVANEFEDVTDPGSHVLEKFQDMIVNRATAGVVNAILSPFSGVTTGDAAMKIVSQKHQDLIESGKFSDKDAAAILWQSWKSTLQAHDTMAAPGVNKQIFEDEIQRRSDALSMRKDKQASLNSTKLSINTQLQSMRSNSRSRLFEIGKNTRKSNRTGKATKGVSKLNSQLTGRQTGRSQIKWEERAAAAVKGNEENPKPSALSELIGDIKTDDPIGRMREMLKLNPGNKRLRARLNQKIRKQNK